MSIWRDRLFRRTQPVTVITADGTFIRRGVLQELEQGAVPNALEPRWYGSLRTPLYRYMGNARELLQEGNVSILAQGRVFSVLHAKEIFGFPGCTYIEAVLERQVTDDDGE